MKVNGIIAEYNPFHNGHRYQLEESRKRTGADYTIVVMSGNFVQRGAPAALDKHVRAEMALRNGADLVLELPALYAASSSEFFAAGAVALLDKLGVVTHLCFGSECGHIGLLHTIAAFLLAEPEEYRSSLRQSLKQGLSYPSARATAVSGCAGLEKDCAEILSSPNNILGIDYIKALLKRESHIVPMTVKRIGSGYHDGACPISLPAGMAQDNSTSFSAGTAQGSSIIPPAGTAQNDSLSHVPFLSALALRRALQEGRAPGQLLPYLPDATVRLLDACLAEHRLLYPDDFSTLLYYKLLTEQEQGYEKYLDVSPGLSDRIRRRLGEFTGFEAFCGLLKTKDMTYTRISRCLLHILLGMEQVHMDLGLSLDYVPYARVLGFRKDAAPLLNALKAHSAIPLITKLADASKSLSADADRLLRQDIYVSHLYQGVAATHTGGQPRNEFTTPLAIL